MLHLLWIFRTSSWIWVTRDSLRVLERLWCQQVPIPLGRLGYLGVGARVPGSGFAGNPQVAGPTAAQIAALKVIGFFEVQPAASVKRPVDLMTAALSVATDVSGVCRRCADREMADTLWIVVASFMAVS